MIAVPGIFHCNAEVGGFSRNTPTRGLTERPQTFTFMLIPSLGRNTYFMGSHLYFYFWNALAMTSTGSLIASNSNDLIAI